MFGIIISGRPVLANPQSLSSTQFTFNLPSTPPFSHLVVFLLPGTQLPPDTAAAVYVQLSPDNSFKLLGAISNEKQSAIFKINNSGASLGSGIGGGAGVSGGDAMMDDGTSSGTGGAAGNITVGISVEPALQISSALAAMRSQSQTSAPSGTSAAGSGMALVKSSVPTGTSSGSPVPTKVLAQRIIANAFNFLASFAGTMGPGGQEVVPLKSFQDWWAKFEKRIERDPGFLERETS